MALAAIIAASSGITPPSALAGEGAGTDELRQAQEDAAHLVYEEGRRLFAEGKLADALDRFEKANAVLDNVFIRFYLGLTYARVDRCDEALDHLSAVREQVAAADAAREKERAEAEAGCRLVRARAALSDFRCRDALTETEPVRGAAVRKALRSDLDAIEREARTCDATFDTSGTAGRSGARRLAEARAHLAAGRTEEAAASAEASIRAAPTGAANLLLAVARVRSKRCPEGLEALARAEALGPTGSGPLADEVRKACLTTSSAQAAWKLYEIGVKELVREDPAKAESAFRNALVLYDAPHLRRGLAEALYRGKGDCPAAVLELRRIPEPERIARDLAFAGACTGFGPPADLSGKERRLWLDHLRETLLAREEGRTADALQSAEAAQKIEDAEPLGHLVADLVLAAGDCEAFSRAAARWPRPTDPDTARRCLGGGDPEPGDGASPSRPEPDPATAVEVAAVREAPRSRVLEWTLVGSGAALTAGSAWFFLDLVGQNEIIDETAAESAQATGDEFEAIQKRHETAKDRASLDQIVGAGLAVAGVAAIVTGSILFAAEDEQTSQATGPAIRVLWTGTFAGLSLSF